MQWAVERDSENRSNYAMCAVNPSRISKSFSDAALKEVVGTISMLSGSFLEIMNYNVEVCFFLTSSYYNRFSLYFSYRVSNMCALESCRTPNDDQCTKLPQAPENWHHEGLFSNTFSRFQTKLSAVEKVKGLTTSRFSRVCFLVALTSSLPSLAIIARLLDTTNLSSRHAVVVDLLSPSYLLTKV